jgi:hypothetical protein
MEDAADSVIDSVRNVLTDIESMLNGNRDQWENYLSTARSTIASIEEVNFFSLTNRLAEQRWIVQVLQDYAYHDSDDGSIQDIADWCQASWLRILQDHPDDMDTLTGLFYQLSTPPWHLPKVFECRDRTLLKRLQYSVDGISWL